MASIAAVNSSFLRISATVKALRIVESMCSPRLALDDLRAAAGRLDRLARGRAEGVGVDGELLRQRAAREHLDRYTLAVGQAVGVQRIERNLITGVEAPLEVDEVDGLRVRPERLERHRLLHVRAAQL